MKRKVLLFDLDWTLVYTGGAGIRALNHAFEQHFQIPRVMETVIPDGKTDRAIIREIFKLSLYRDPTREEFDMLCKAYVERLEEEIQDTPGYRVMPGIPDLLKELMTHSEICMGLGTGNLKEGARIKLSVSGFFEYFRFGGFADDSEDRPTLLATAVQRAEALLGHRVAPRDVIVIGDNKRDVHAGQAIDATTVAVATGPMGMDELAKTNPHRLFKDLSDTREVLNFLLS